jgi:hypothetical protein
VRSTALLGERRMLYVCRPLPAGGGGPGFGRAALADLAGAEPEYFVCGRIFGGARKVVNAFNGIYYGCLSRSLGAGHMGPRSTSSPSSRTPIATCATCTCSVPVRRWGTSSTTCGAARASEGERDSRLGA